MDFFISFKDFYDIKRIYYLISISTTVVDFMSLDQLKRK